MQKKLLVCIVGPTAIGKTALSIKIATALKTEIISADSRQFYKEMKIGTAVPSEEELAEVPHHFIQHISIINNYSVGDFERDALLKLSELFQNKDIVVMVGGSGLYVDAVIKGLDYFPEIVPEIREQLNEILASEGIESLQQELKKVDPSYFSKIDIYNPRRLIRALEVYHSSGKTYSSFLKKHETQREFETIYIGLTAERPVIYERINKRVNAMIENGLLEEAKNLFPQKNLNALQTVGYRELFNYFENNLALEEAIKEIKKNTRRFAKRQMTWFRKSIEIIWFDYLTDPKEIIDLIKVKNALK